MPALAQDGIKRAWRLACLREGIDPRQATILPLLFAIERELLIENGFFYEPDCSNEIRRSDASGSYCAAHIGCSSGCADDSGGDNSADSDGGGCGGD